MSRSKKSKRADFTICGVARLSLTTGDEGEVHFRFSAAGCVPTYGDVFGDAALIDAAWHAGQATIAMRDITFRVNVLRRSYVDDAIIIDSAPLFRAAVAQLKKAG
jgi:hypothetical protein